MNRNSKSAITKLLMTVLIAMGLLVIYRLWPQGPFAGLSIGCFALTAGPIFILVAIDTGRALRKDQLGQTARIATWLPQLILCTAACVAALCGFGFAAFDRTMSMLRFIWVISISVVVLVYGVSLFTKVGGNQADELQRRSI
jgi:hypothetical protein